MTTQYTRHVLRIVVAQICQTIGWHSVNSTPLEFMVDLMQEYIVQISKLAQQYSQILNRCETNLDDLGLAFDHMNIDLKELSDYIKNVESVPCVIKVPKLPIHKENHLNFLKPGSKEVVTRPMYVHEHLPPMYPEETYESENKEADSLSNIKLESVNETDEDMNESNIENIDITSLDDSVTKTQNVFKRPGDPILNDGLVVKRIKNSDDERPLREIHSVIMTTSGFLSTAREGKLPEARTPLQTCTDVPSPPEVDVNEVKIENTESDINQEIPEVLEKAEKMEKIEKIEKPDKIDKKIRKSLKKNGNKPENKENKKKKVPKDTLFIPDQMNDVKIKKIPGTKEVTKIKAVKANKLAQSMAGPSNNLQDGRIQNKIVISGCQKNNKNFTLQNKLKVEKGGLTITPVCNPIINDYKTETFDKLPFEPDKQKLNIFKKISAKQKEDKERETEQHFKLKDLNFKNESPNLMINENIDKHFPHRINNDYKQEDNKSAVSIAAVNNNIERMSKPEVNMMHSQYLATDNYMYDDMSLPGTPSTPKTPEFNVPINTEIEQKKKRKEKGLKKKEPKIKVPKNISTKKEKLYNEMQDYHHTLPERPKTPQAPENPPFIRDLPPPTLPFPFFNNFPNAPGLIPRPMFPNNYPLNIHKTPSLIPQGPTIRQRFIRPSLDKSFMHPPNFQDAYQPPPYPMKPVDKIIRPHLDNDLTISRVPNNYYLPNPTPGVPPIPPGLTITPVPTPPPIQYPLQLPNNSPLPTQIIKTPKHEKLEKKSKEHKKEKKDKLKKKKEKKDKHKEKGEKIKDKKDKLKKLKLEKIREKKEKKEKRKEKEALKKLKEEKNLMPESVPKITLKIGLTGSPRSPTPDSALTKKITIKPPKKPEDEVLIQREPSPELAKISALITRPPKVKSTSKKSEEGIYESAVPSDSIYTNRTSVSIVPQSKKSMFKPLPPKEPSPTPTFINQNPILKTVNSVQTPVQSFSYIDQGGRQIWICPACGKQDDGSPMIGCDDCDAWYHWICVGICVAPADNEDWYCRSCIIKKQEQYHDKKKKKRKKKLKDDA